MDFVLTLATVLLIFLNGATDASNAIAASVTSGALRMRTAALLAAVCNAAGGIVGGIAFRGISEAILGTADFGRHGLSGTCAVLGAAVIFTFAAWRIGMPTSESHALLAAAAGASLILGGSDAPAALMPAVLWMTLCTGTGFLAGMTVTRIFPRSLSPLSVRRMQILCAAAASFLHGAQDLVKFTALLSTAGGGNHPLFLPLAAAVMGFGTLCGGRRMTEAVGERLAELDNRTALATDLGSAAALSILSLCGIPASTTHARTASAAGGALLSPHCRLHRRQCLRFLIAWILTFPLCAALSAFLCSVLLAII